MDSRFANLLSRIRIGNVEVRNRIVSSAYQTNLGLNYRPTPSLVEFHTTRARGGVGLIILEGVRVHPTARGTQANLDGWDEEAIPLFREIVDSVHRQGAKMFAQILHQGRAANPMDTLLPHWSASRIPAPPVFGLNTSEMTHAMTKAEIEEVIQWWAQCAVNMKRAGMDGVEVHGGHGYLVNQFLSPLTNFRTDEYGGSLQNRARFALEVAGAVRQAVGQDYVCGMRISADELVPGGLTIEDTSQLARWLEDSGDVNYLNITHSTTEPTAHAQQIPDMSWPQAPFAHLAEAIKKATRGIPVSTVGRIIDPFVAEGIIADGKADLVCMTRAQIADPEIGLKLMEGRPDDIRQCIGCNQGCAGRINAGQTVGCLINPEAGRERELGPILPAARSKSVAVVGGGPAGMEAARVAALRGHSVVIYERQDRLGGQINAIVKAPHRQDFGKIVEWLEGQLEKLGVVVKLNTEATPQQLQAAGAEAIIIATGSVPDLPEIPGIGQPGSPRLASAQEVLEGGVTGVSRAVLLDADGHHKAASTAEFLADQGLKVHLVTQAESIAAEITSISRTPAIKRLVDRGVSFHRLSWIKEVAGRRAVLSNSQNGDEQAIEDVDLIVAAVPQRPATELDEAIRKDGPTPEVLVVGDCVAPRRALEAIREGHMAARSL